MHTLKNITKEGIQRALEKVERYRLLNEPSEAESICRDILSIEPDNQKAIAQLILCLSDQFISGVSGQEAEGLIAKLGEDYQRHYYKGILLEREAKAAIHRGSFGSSADAFDWLEEAMESFESAAAIRPKGNDDAILRYNACIRTIQRHHLSQRAQSAEPMLE